jgi:lysophospholipase L1-like esterase
MRDAAKPMRFPTAAFYGDSITTGHRGTSAPRSRWSSLVCDDLSWREINIAMDGMGFYRRRGPYGPDAQLTPSATDTTLLDAVIRLNPDVVVVCLSANDLPFMDDHAETVAACTLRDFQRLATGLPKTPVVAVTYFPGTELSQRGQRIVANVERACAETGATYVDSFRYVVDGNLTLLAPDEIHPNDAGHRALADAILPTLRGLDLPG